MDGFYLCGLIKQEDITKNIPVIILTGKDMGDDFELAMKKHADWYIVKPFDDNYLMRTISNILKRKRPADESLYDADNSRNNQS